MATESYHPHGGRQVSDVEATKGPAEPAIPRFLAMIDVVSAALVGASLRALVELIQWFEAHSGQGRPVIAAWLTLSVIAGNLLTAMIAAQ
jgi:hypothetical protein